MKGEINMTTKKDDSILIIDIKTKTGGNQSVDLAEDLKINIDDLSESYIDQPGKYAWWAVLAAQARASADRKKSEVENLEDYIKKTLKGELDAEVREDLELSGEKITENKVDNGIYSHPKYVEKTKQLHSLRLEYVELNETASILEAARNALDQRKDVLISLGAQLRSEIGNTGLSLKKEQARQVLNNKGF